MIHLRFTKWLADTGYLNVMTMVSGFWISVQAEVRNNFAWRALSFSTESTARGFINRHGVGFRLIM